VSDDRPVINCSTFHAAHPCAITVLPAITDPVIITQMGCCPIVSCSWAPQMNKIIVSALPNLMNGSILNLCSFKKTILGENSLFLSEK